MRLPGTRYQEPGWERVRKLLGSASLALMPHASAIDTLDAYCTAMALALQQTAGTARAEAAGNSYGDSALSLAQTLVCELRVLPSFWQADLYRTQDAVALRKKVNDMFVTLRDRVDADYYQIATGRPCSANKIYTWRMLDSAYHDIERLLQDWQSHTAQLSAILDRPILAQPIESRRVRSAADCDPNWIIRWSATQEQFGRGTGPLHTRSKRFSSLKNNPATIGKLLQEIADYEALSATGSADWQFDDEQFDAWHDDYARVIAESERAEAVSHRDRILPLDQQLRRASWQDAAMADWDGASGDASEAEADAPDGEADREAGRAAGENGSDAANYAVAENLFVPGLEEMAEAADIQADTQVETQADALANEARQRHLLALLQEQGLLAGLGAESASESASEPAPATVFDPAIASALALPPDYMLQAGAAEDRDSLMYRALQQESLSVRLALYSKQLGAWDESYPDAWLDPATGQLPSLQQLAALDQVSVPTLRKRRDLALQRLCAASRAGNKG
jgi:hypothetical protein